MIMMVFMSLTIVDGIFISRLVGTDALFPQPILYIGAEPRDRHRRHARNRRKCDHREKDGGGKGAGSAGRLLFPDRYRNHPRISCDVSRKRIYNSARTTTRRNRSDPGSLHRYLSVSFFGACLYLTTALSGIFVTAGKPTIGLILTISGGVANMILDYLFMGPLEMGVRGAALATGIGQLIPAVFGILYFLFVRKELYLVRPKHHPGVLLGSCSNGSSEMVTNLSTAIVTYLFNIMMLKYVGEAGVSAITIVLYGQFYLTQCTWAFPWASLR